VNRKIAVARIPKIRKCSPVNRDDSEHELVPECAAPQGQLDLLPPGQMPLGWELRDRPGKPAVAPDAAVPPDVVGLNHQQCILGTDFGDVRADELVPPKPAGDEFVMKPGPKPRGRLCTRWAVTALMAHGAG